LLIGFWARRRCWAGCAIALLPFFAVNTWFVKEVPILNRWMAQDFGANAAMLGLSVWGWRVIGRCEFGALSS